MDTEAQTRENTKAIGDLTNTVTRLATVVDLAEKQRIEDRADVRNIFIELKAIGEKMGSVAGMMKDIATLMGDMRTLRHDLNNVQQAQNAIPLLKEAHVQNEKDIDNHETRLDALEKDKDTRDGAIGAVKLGVHAIWAFASIGGISFVIWFCKFIGVISTNTGGHINGF